VFVANENMYALCDGKEKSLLRITKGTSFSYKPFHRFGKAKFGDGGLILVSSPVVLNPLNSVDPQKSEKVPRTPKMSIRTICGPLNHCKRVI